MHTVTPMFVFYVVWGLWASAIAALYYRTNGRNVEEDVEAGGPEGRAKVRDFVKGLEKALERGEYWRVEKLSEECGVQRRGVVWVFRLFVFMYIILATIGLLHWLVPVALAAGFDEKYALNYIESSQGLMEAFLAVTPAMATALADAVGTNPEKNWIKFLALMTAKFSDDKRRGTAIFLMYMFSAYSSNPKVWERLMAAKSSCPAEFHQAFDDVKSCYGNGTNSFLVWTKGADGMPDKDHFRTTQIPGANPPLYLLAWAVALPAGSCTHSALLGLKVFPAMSIDNDVLEQSKWRQQEFMNTVLKKKTWEQKFFDTVSQSNFFFPGKPSGASGSRSVKAYAKDRANYQQTLNWLNAITSRSDGLAPKKTAYTWNATPA